MTDAERVDYEFEHNIASVPTPLVDAEFQSLIPSLSSDELSQLEASLVKEGCRDALAVWKGKNILLDGHNRLAILTRHNIPFRVVEVELEDREEAADWIDANQLGRRNLTPDAFKFMLGRRYNRTKQTPAEAGAKGGSSSGQVVHRLPKTSETLAAEHGVSERTVRRAGDFASKVEADPDLQESILKRKPHVSQNSGDNEWYTPQSYVNAARDVLGKIDLDPASSEEANKVVKAENIFTAADDGLKRDWAGKLWLNPPYTSDLVGKFIEKLAASVESGKVTEALVLVNNATETKWFARLVSISSCLCFPTGRVKFWHPSKSATPLQGQCVAYVGKHDKNFHTSFKAFGAVVKVIR